MIDGISIKPAYDKGFNFSVTKPQDSQWFMIIAK